MIARMRRAGTWIVGVVLVAAVAHGQTPTIPAHNRADQRVPPARPDASSAERRAKQLFEAILHDDPQRAEGVFFPRAAFLLVKDIRDPGAYFDQLHARFASDIHALHKRLPDLAHAQFERFELVRRGGFVAVREEGNRLPYWASRHSVLHYESEGVRHQFEVRVLITWDDEWYVIHLNEFH
jgi:hypothetical protein